MTSAPPVALTIAGFDPSSGAGITADLAVFAVFGLFGTAVITSKTVQSTRGVAGREDSSPEHLLQSLEYLAADLPPAGIKIGALGNAELVRAVGGWLSGRKKNISVVWDPALISSSGTVLVDLDALEIIHTVLLPAIGWVTPNWSELATLSGQPVASAGEVDAAARALRARHPSLGIVVTGGDQVETTDILFLPGGTINTFPGERVESTSTHGTGCAFSSAFLAGLVRGQDPAEAAASAKSYVVEAIRQAPGLGSGRGPLGLYWPLMKSQAS